MGLSAVGGRSPVWRTAGFTALYLAATYAGRLTVMDDTNLSLVWPAAGVSALWFLVRYASPWRALDVLALTVVTVAVNVATGAPAVLATWFVVANVLQAGLFAVLMRRWTPHLWGCGGERPLARISELWRLVSAAFLATAGGALIGPTGVWAVTGSYSWSATAVWLTRNTVSILLIAAVGLRLGHLLREHRTGAGKVLSRRTWAGLDTSRRLEYVAVLVLSAASYTVVFGVNTHLPLAFAVIGMTVWAATRLHTVFVVLHDLVFGSVAVLFTLAGRGVFAQIDSHPARALVAQLFVGMIAVAGLALALGRDERTELVRDLRGAQQSADRQAKLMGAIVDTMNEGLTVVDEQGRFLLRNPALRELVGGVAGRSDRMAQPDFYGMFHPDGTPLRPDEMPYRRALAGEDVRDMDILIRNPDLPEGRILNASSRALPLDLDGTRCAVTVLHDVTAERRHRGELASFAGVVAHDLLNPLTTIEGWAEALGDTAGAGAPAGSPAATGIGRISRAAARMRNLINDLLAYTTARDAAISPATVDVGEMVRDIAAGRIDQAESTGRPVPVFEIGELRPVYADPVLIRQLLENLISNAVKYTAAGVTPRLRIGSDRVGDMVTMTIDDNGIGIPEGQHGSIFGDFHRAHTDGGYAGTGLGLGICKRIVERHGGTIGAAAHPDGAGSRFTFTLPAEAAALPDSPQPQPQPQSQPRPQSQPHPQSGPQSQPQPEAPPVEAGTAPVARPTPADPVPVSGVFAQAAHLVLEYLHEEMPLAFWAVTRVENGRQTYLYLDADNGYGLRQGQSHPWQDSFCVHMAAGRAPAVARDARADPLYAGARINERIDIGTYAGAPIVESDGSLFGAICGLDPQTHTEDPRMAGAERLLVLLGRMLTTALAADRTQDRSADALLREQLNADTDELTGLPNRRAWQRAVERAQERHQRLADPTVVAILDLDGLKAVNDGLGHAAGDAYLQAAANAARRALRDTDVIARIGGDEFGLLLTPCERAGAEAVVARVNAELDAAGVTASIGWASVSPEHGLAGALGEADAAMYRAKQQRHRETAPA
ncbi:diguanylate cyclase [Actinoplanes sp. NPDC023714]|uniref:diguanylate cyclase domain-containing protein n=1 Tax=Actinoplanes sp. NPDC023714 TaxID=3154322 RepID=UPI003408E1BD